MELNTQRAGTLIVTGASRGIGAATARLAGQRGYAVAVNFNRGEAEAKKVAKEIVDAGGRARHLHADVSREADILALFHTADVTGGFARVENVTTDAIERAFSVNVTGAMLCAREAVRRMSTRHGGSG